MAPGGLLGPREQRMPVGEPDSGHVEGAGPRQPLFAGTGGLATSGPDFLTWDSGHHTGRDGES